MRKSEGTTFEAWMGAVNGEVESRLMVCFDDLPDVHAPRDNFDDDLSPAEFAAELAPVEDPDFDPWSLL